MTIENLVKHLKHSCQQILIDCPRGCGAQFQRMHAAEHFYQCEKRILSCAFCTEQVDASAMPLHANWCLAYLRNSLAIVS